MLNLRFVTMSRPSGIPGRLFGSLFFVFFLGMGVLFLVLTTKEVVKRGETLRWPIVPCTIVSSSVAAEKSSENPFRFAVNYQYQFRGRSYHSQRAELSETRSGNYRDVLRMVERYPEKAQAICYVNPAHPEEAILQRSSFWFALLLVVPIPFIVIGGLGIWAMWQPPTSSLTQPAFSRTVSPRTRSFSLALFFSIFLVAGLAAFAFLVIRPMMKIQQSRHWLQLPCTILSSEVRPHHGDNGTTYSVDIFYQYFANGKEYKANRYSFLTGSSSGYDGKAAVVARYRPGTKALCFVNPADPTEAVLVRRVTPEMWFGLLPTIFAVVGVCGLVYCVRQSRLGKNSSITAIPAGFMAGAQSPPTSDLGGPIELKARISPRMKLVGGLIVALFWNGIVSVFVVHLINGWKHGRGEWFSTIFMIPFVLIGLGLVGFVVYSLVGLFSPRVKLTVSSASALPGARIQFNWTLEGKVQRVSRLQIYFEGREEATYKRGTDTSTDKAVFATIPIVDIQENFRVGSGNAELQVPACAIHSFSSEHNKIIWSLFVKADVTHMPDVKDEFELFVLPQPLAPPMKV